MRSSVISLGLFVTLSSLAATLATNAATPNPPKSPSPRPSVYRAASAFATPSTPARWPSGRPYSTPAPRWQTPPVRGYDASSATHAKPNDLRRNQDVNHGCSPAGTTATTTTTTTTTNSNGITSAEECTTTPKGKTPPNVVPTSAAPGPSVPPKNSVYPTTTTQPQPRKPGWRTPPAAGPTVPATPTVVPNPLPTTPPPVTPMVVIPYRQPSPSAVMEVPASMRPLPRQAPLAPVPSSGTPSFSLAPSAEPVAEAADDQVISEAQAQDTQDLNDLTTDLAGDMDSKIDDLKNNGLLSDSDAQKAKDAAKVNDVDALNAALSGVDPANTDKVAIQNDANALDQITKLGTKLQNGTAMPIDWANVYDAVKNLPDNPGGSVDRGTFLGKLGEIAANDKILTALKYANAGSGSNPGTSDAGGAPSSAGPGAQTPDFSNPAGPAGASDGTMAAGTPSAGPAPEAPSWGDAAPANPPPPAPNVPPIADEPADEPAAAGPQIPDPISAAECPAMTDGILLRNTAANAVNYRINGQDRSLARGALQVLPGGTLWIIELTAGTAAPSPGIA